MRHPSTVLLPAAACLALAVPACGPRPAPPDVELSGVNREALWKQDMDAGLQAQAREDLAEAEKHLTAALKQAERLGLSDRRRAESLSKLGELYMLQGRYAEAEPLLKRSLE